MGLEFEIVLRLVISGVLAALIGWERKSRDKEAGLRTHFVVSVGSTLIMLVSKYGFNDILHPYTVVLDPSRIAAQVVSGIGFLGAGTILVQRQSIKGLTTAAGLWATAGIGLAIGAGMYTAGIAATILVLIALELLNRTDKWFFSKSKRFVIRALNINPVLATLNESGFKIRKIQINNASTSSENQEVALTVMLEAKKDADIQTLIVTIQQITGVLSIKVD